MKNQNPVIVGVEYYHPDNIVHNDFYINHFKQKGIDVSGLLKSTGRKTRFISNDENETVLTMGIEAAKRVLEKTDISPKELNGIVFSSGIVEYVSPCNAIKIHGAIGAGENLITYDLNANCAGMLIAFDQTAKVMRSDANIKYALIVGSEKVNTFAHDDDSLTYTSFGDLSCAIILENKQETTSGFIDSESYSDSSFNNNILYPPKGMTSVANAKELDIQDKKIKWIPFDIDGTFIRATVSIDKLLERNKLTKNDIKKYFFSQFTLAGIKLACESMKEDINKFVFVGDEYGYTGTTSPFLAYAKAIENNELNPGDYVIFWTVGAGVTCNCCLYRY